MSFNSPLDQLDREIRQKKQALKLKCAFIEMKQKQFNETIQTLFEKKTKLQSAYDNARPIFFFQKEKEIMSFRQNIDSMKSSLYLESKKALISLEQQIRIQKEQWNVANPIIFEQISSFIHLIEHTRKSLNYNEFYKDIFIDRSLETSIRNLQSLSLRIEASNTLFQNNLHKLKKKLDKIIAAKQDIIARDTLLKNQLNSRYDEMKNQEQKFEHSSKEQLLHIKECRSQKIHKSRQAARCHRDEAQAASIEYRNITVSANSAEVNQLKAKIRVANVILQKLQAENYRLKSSLSFV